MRKTIIISLTILAVIGSTAFFLHSKYRWFSSLKIQAINAVPDNAAIIIESKNTFTSWEKLRATSSWSDLSQQKYVKELNLNYLLIDSVIKNNDELKSIIKSNAIVVSIHPTGLNDYDFLYLVNLPPYEDENYVNDIITEVFHLNPKTNAHRYEGVEINELEFKGIGNKKSIFSYAVNNGIFAASFSSFLVEDAIRKIKHPDTFSKDVSFSLVKSAAGSNVDANLYVNFKTLPKFFLTYVSTQNYGIFDPLKTFTNWSEMDLKINDDSFMFNGFTASGDSVPTYLSMFIKQKPHKIGITKVLPYNTAVLLYFGLNDFKTFFADYIHYTTAHSYEKVLTAPISYLKQEYNLTISDDLIPWIGNEYAFAFLENPALDNELEPIAIIHAQPGNVEVSLNNIIDKVNSKLKEVSEEINLEALKQPYRGYKINYINLPNLLPLIFGELFKSFETPYFIIIDEYVIFANNISTLNNLVDSYLDDNTLIKNTDYLKFSENVSSEANLYMYVNSPRTIKLLKKFASDKFSTQIDENISYFKKFDKFSYQLSSSGKMFYSNLYLQYNKTLKEDTKLKWKLQLNAPVYMKPQIVNVHNSKEKEILVQDESNILYLISKAGKIIWKIQLKSPILSNIYTIDFYGNNKLQFLFNTDDYIHLIDRNGKKIENYPVKLKSKTTKGISVFDYDNKKDYRIFVTCGNEIYAYKKDGDIVKEWGPKKLNGIVKFPVQYFSLEGKDYLLAITEKGSIYIMDRKGDPRINVKKNLPSISNNPCIVNLGENIKTTSIICTDTTGEIYSIYLDGNIYNFKLHTLTAQHYFDYQKIQENKNYIFLDDNKLYVYDQDTSEKFTQRFDISNLLRPQYFKFSDKTGKIGITSFESNQLFLYNEDGSLYSGFPLKGSTSFSIADLNNEGVFKLITGSKEGYLYCYDIK